MVNDKGYLALPLEAAEQVTVTPIGNLTPVVTRTEETVAIAAMDTFDEELAARNMLLLERGAVPDLHVPDGALLTQEAMRGAGSSP
ncbi:hypothetical protein [Sagittula salina]|uniref:Uncharacterized protein n=1 Tax=Sagittula salina TaxID=2820268 RepID=A0A940MTL1_9RHOB|nr:hypothetical protein [Sagittula salina]MBP0485154.1 hypothetical protein [Sagittula salina]